MVLPDHKVLARHLKVESIYRRDQYRIQARTVDQPPVVGNVNSQNLQTRFGNGSPEKGSGKYKKGWFREMLPRVIAGGHHSDLEIRISKISTIAIMVEISISALSVTRQIRPDVAAFPHRRTSTEIWNALDGEIRDAKHYSANGRTVPLSFDPYGSIDNVQQEDQEEYQGRKTFTGSHFGPSGRWQLGCHFDPQYGGPVWSLS